LNSCPTTGCSSWDIYCEKVTRARAARRELLRTLDRLAAGDVVPVTWIVRLARSTFDLFGVVKRIVDPRRNSAPGGALGRH
jgi:DNA invertase Pin-like site-specific DNA recombinase